ncbi:MAG: hypothetical protein AB7F19_04535 [Candidatus Babeliales bacterium]
MFTNVKFLLSTLLFTISFIQAYSQDMYYQDERLAEFRKQEEERYFALENYLAHEASEDVRKMVRVLEQDTFKIMHMYGEIIESLVIKTRPLVEKACANSVMPVLSITGSIGSLCIEIDDIAKKYFFIEEERDLMQQDAIEEFIAYINNRLEQFFALIDGLSNHEGHRNVSLLTIDNELKNSIYDQFNNIFLKTDALSQQVFSIMLQEIKESIPLLQHRYSQFLHDMLVLREHVNCDSETFVLFVDCRLERMGTKFKECLFYQDEEYAKYFDIRAFENLTPQDITLLFAMFLKNVDRCKETAWQEYNNLV